MGFGFADGAGFAPLPAFPVRTPLAGSVAVAEPWVPLLVVVIGPAAALAVSDAVTACVDELVLLPFAADADFVPPPLHAAAAVAIAIEKRIERFIFRGCFLE